MLMPSFANTQLTYPSHDVTDRVWWWQKKSWLWHKVTNCEIYQSGVSRLEPAVVMLSIISVNKVNVTAAFLIV